MAGIIYRFYDKTIKKASVKPGFLAIGHGL
jgi:hypothetical protein